MGYTVDLQTDWLWCKSEEDARAAAAIINGNESFSYWLQVEAEQNGDGWCLCVTHFQGDHWRNDEAEAIWTALAPHMADDASIEFQGEELDRWRIRWRNGRCFEDRVKEVVWIEADEINTPKEEESRT
jgi:hypothetical protein